MDLSGVFASEWKYLYGTEAVTLFRKLSDGTYDAGTAVANALRLEVQKVIAGSGRIAAKIELSWYLWASQTSTPAVKRDDYIQDGTGAKWLVKDCDVQAWGARYLCQTVQER